MSSVLELGNKPETLLSEDPYQKEACDAFFTDEPVPSTIAEDRKALDEFVAKHNAAGRRIAIVTSGGTTIPLEVNTVRFLDNFSAGTRGAASTEYFLELGYAVIFLHRRFSLEPFSRQFTPAAHNWLDFLTPDKAGDPSLKVEAGRLGEQLFACWRRYSDVQQEGLLLRVSFVTLADYLHQLRNVSQAVRPCGSNAVLYLAAAVSDFYLPTKMMAEHKIQSADGPLSLNLQRVPKMLLVLHDEWCPQAFIVSFKLETDPSLLLKKAKHSLSRYAVHLVVANLLQTRKDEVQLVNETSSVVVSRGDDAEIERALIVAIKARHDDFIQRASTK
eukprot:TRINITY_DN13090_c0_g1_i1.p1 TRINITY_DN13090_c0_g1~~TRINITY_DN13090_c0_g1_i1.p1  ORF type:complete len:345 (+),score=63.65 TRINITY_DN13090_c0_g1_i1:43-1035(+)